MPVQIDSIEMNRLIVTSNFHVNAPSLGQFENIELLHHMREASHRALIHQP